MRVVWTEQALERLLEIQAYIERDAPERAAAFIEKLIRKGERLDRYPHAGRKVPELDSEQHREVLEGHYRIVYRLHPRHIEILTVFEGHHRLPKEDIH